MSKKTRKCFINDYILLFSHQLKNDFINSGVAK